MIPVVDKPAIQYVVEEAVRSGIDDILIITGRNKHSLEDHFDRRIELEHELESKGKHDLLSDVRELADLADIHYVRQGEPLGLGHAVSVARKHVGDHPFVVMLGRRHHGRPLDGAVGDDRHPHRHRVLGHRLQGVPARAHQPLRVRGLRAGGRAAAQGAGHRGEAGRRRGRPSSWAVLGRYVFTPGIFDAIEKVGPGAGGEIQLTDAIGVLLAAEEVLGYTFVDGRYDVGNKQDYLRATVELALAREDLGPEFRRWLAQYVRDQGIV